MHCPLQSKKMHPRNVNTKLVMKSVQLPNSIPSDILAYVLYFLNTFADIMK